MFRSSLLKIVSAAAMTLAVPALAEVQPVDPNAPGAYPQQADPYQPQPQPQADPYQPQSDPYGPPPRTAPAYEQVDPGSQDPYTPVSPNSGPAQARVQPPATVEVAPSSGTLKPPPTQRIAQNEVLAAAENVFGRGTEGLGAMIQSILRDQGEPVAYIAGQEAGGAFAVGLRYGSGMMRHKIEGDRPVYWTGPSIGFDLGADANKVFVLVYNLHDSQDLYRRYPSAEGHAYVIGGLTASYLRRGDVVLVPVRLGVGLRLGVNAGYMKFSEKNRWLPF